MSGISRRSFIAQHGTSLVALAGFGKRVFRPLTEVLMGIPSVVFGLVGRKGAARHDS